MESVVKFDYDIYYLIYNKMVYLKGVCCRNEEKNICTIKLHTTASILSLSDRQYLASAPLF